MNIRKFLKKHNILWGYISGVESKPYKPHFNINGQYFKYDGYLKDEKSKNILLESQKYPTACICYDTSRIHCVDIDDDKLNVEKFKKKYNYCLSKNRRLPHFFCKITNYNNLHLAKYKTPIKQIDVLNGCMSWAKANEKVIINNKKIKKLDLSKIYDLYQSENIKTEKKEKKIIDKNIKSTVNRPKPTIEQHNILKIFQNLDPSRYENYNTWFQVGCWLHWYFNGSEEGKNHFRMLSLKSRKPEHKKYIFSPEFDQYWDKINSNVAYSIYTFLIWLKNDNKEQYDNLKLDSTNKYNQIKYEFEKDHFHVIKSNAFFKYVMGEWTSYNKAQFQDIVAEYDYFEGKKQVSFFSKWIRDKDRRKYLSIDWTPKETIENKNIFNEFQGFKLDDKYKHYDEEAVKIFTDHIKYLCSDHQESYKYFIDYLSHLFQKPFERPQSAVVIVSPEGTGKDLIIDFIASILGSEFCLRTSNMKRDLFGSSNGGAKNKIVLQLNEVSNLDGFKNIDQIKDIITSEKLIIRQLYQDARPYTNYLRVFVFSNNNNPLKVSYSSRRFFILKLKKVNTKEYYNKLVKVLNNENALKSIYNYFLNLDISKFNPSIIPDTEGKKYLVDCNKPIIYEFLEDKMKDFKNENVFFSSKELLTQYRAFMDDYGYDNKFNSKNLKAKLDGVSGIQYGRNGTKRGFKIDFNEIEYFIKEKYGDLIEFQD